jgi:integrase
VGPGCRIRVPSSTSRRGATRAAWLSVQQAQALLNAPDASLKKGLRDRAILAVLLGCGLRRSEVAALTLRHIQQRDSRWCIVDLVGKHGRVRPVPIPTWVKQAMDAWTSAAGVCNGPVFRTVNRGDQVQKVTPPDPPGRLLLAGRRSRSSNLQGMGQ